MIIETRLINLNNDYELFSKWWIDHNHVIIPKDMLSEFGVICYINKKPIAAMWLYPVLSCKWSMIRFPISSKDSSKNERNIAMDYVLNNLFNISKDMGYTNVFCTTNHSSLIKKLKKIGMTLSSEDCKHFWGAL